jgi:hypothetical protein
MVVVALTCCIVRIMLRDAFVVGGCLSGLISGCPGFGGSLELACCVVSADELVVVRFTFSGNVGAWVRRSAQRACVGGGKFVSLS